MRPIASLILGIIALSLLGCGPNRPPLTMCFFSSEARVMKCTDPEGKDYDCDVYCMDEFFGMPKKDAERLLDYVIELEKKAARGKR